jgi:site-specific recombinase XerC
LYAFLVKRGHLDTNPVSRLDRPPHRREAPRQMPGSSIQIRPAALKQAVEFYEAKALDVLSR